jgi:hypothetical protein
MDQCMTLVQLSQMPQPLRISGVQHQVGIHATDFEPVSHRAVTAKVSVNASQLLLSFAVLNQVHREHAPPFAATEGGVEGIVIEDCQIAWIRL